MHKIDKTEGQHTTSVLPILGLEVVKISICSAMNFSSGLTNKAKHRLLTSTTVQNPTTVPADGTRIPQQRQALLVVCNLSGQNPTLTKPQENLHHSQRK